MQKICLVHVIELTNGSHHEGDSTSTMIDPETRNNLILMAKEKLNDEINNFRDNEVMIETQIESGKPYS